MVFSSIPVYLDATCNCNWQQDVEEYYRIQNPQLLHRPLPPEDRHVSGGTAGLCKPGSMADRARQANIPQPEAGLKCPRCESTNTKFCYFNNYSLSQPRHFCKTCRRYWTRGGALRNVQVGGGSRRNKKNKRSPSKSPASMDRGQAISNHDGQNIVSRIYATTDLTTSHQLRQTSQSHMTSLQNMNSRCGFQNLGLNLRAEIQAHSDPSRFNMRNTGSTVDQQWRFPSLTSPTFDSSTSVGTYTFQSHQTETPAALALTGDGESPLGTLTSTSTVTTTTRAMAQLPPVKFEDTQALNLATSSSTPSFTANVNQYWGGGNSWTDHLTSQLFFH